MQPGFTVTALRGQRPELKPFEKVSNDHNAEGLETLGDGRLFRSARLGLAVERDLVSAPVGPDGSSFDAKQITELQRNLRLHGTLEKEPRVHVRGRRVQGGRADLRPVLEEDPLVPPAALAGTPNQASPCLVTRGGGRL